MSTRELARPACLAASFLIPVLLATLPAVAENRSARQAAAERYREELAFHVGTLAYVYGLSDRRPHSANACTNSCD